MNDLKLKEELQGVLALEQALRENIPPPGYDILTDAPSRGEFGWSSGPHRLNHRIYGYGSRRQACLEAWRHFEENGLNPGSNR